MENQSGYREITVEVRNSVNIVGYIDSEINLSHEVHGEKIFTFMLRVPRVNSKVEDTLIVELPERGNNLKEFKLGDRVRIEGQFRSSNRKVEGEERSHLHLAIFVSSISQEESTYKVNEVRLRGYMCKKPNIRITSKGREVCDMILAVGRNYDRSDYIPCITWGRDAKYVHELEVGTGFFVTGRLQSRKYHKKLSNGEYEEKITYEVSVAEIKEMQKGENVLETKIVPIRK